MFNKKNLAICITLFLSLYFFWFYSSEIFQTEIKKTDIKDIFLENKNQISNPVLLNTSANSKQQKTKIVIEKNIASDFILECQNQSMSQQTPEILEQYMEIGSLENTFKTNKDVSAQMAYALSLDVSNQSDKLNKNSENSVSLLKSLLPNEEYTQLIQFNLLTQCNSQLNNPLCNDSIFDDAINNDPNNGALWLQIAEHEAIKNNTTGVIHALEQIISSASYNEYWAETIEIFDNAQIAIGLVGDQIERHRMVTSIGFSAAVSIAPFQDIFEFCKLHAKHRADIAQLCIDSGKRMIIGSKTLLTQSLGNSLQKIAYQALNDVDSLNKLAEQFAEISNTSPLLDKAQMLMTNDAELLNYWFQQLKLFGESKANNRLIDEAIRLSSDPTYNPCNIE